MITEADKINFFIISICCIFYICFLISPILEDYSQPYEEIINLQLRRLRRRITARRNPVRISNFVETTVQSFSEIEFQSHFRLSLETFNFLFNMTGESLKSPVGRHVIDPKKQLLAVLWLLATPDSYRSIGLRFDMGKSSLFHCFVRVIKVLNKIAPTLINWPHGDYRQQVVEGFARMGSLREVVGAIDGTYVAIKAPAENPQAYINRKCFYGITLQAICDDKRKFTDCFVRYPSSVSDIRIFRNSDIYEAIANNQHHYFEQGQFIIGDKAYPLRTWCVPPYIDRGLQDNERYFNTLHAKTSFLNDETFEGLTKVIYLSLADNNLEAVPENVWKKMPNVKTIDLGRCKIKSLHESSFTNLPHLEVLVLPGNQIDQMETHAIPKRIQKLHLGRNRIRHLNNTLRDLSELSWLFVNSNELTTLENQLPLYAPKLKMIHASNNYLTKLPQQLKTYPLLDSLFFQYNQITSLDGALSKARMLERVVLEHNHIDTITPEDFIDCEMLESLILANNRLTTLNNSLLNLKNLNFLNATYNYLTAFSFEDIVDLPKLQSMDLSFNHISVLKGPPTNLVEWNIRLTELKLDHNELETLNGALSGLPELLRLNLSYNKLKKISPDDLIGLDQLTLLDVSHNYLTTLEETSKTFLPRLSELKATHNYLTILEKDFHGLPVLCHADLSNNQIVALGRDLVTKTRCKIEHGVYEGTWDTLKIYLNDNPILCDAALPEIQSAMEINHTRITGVSHCPPLSEQPVTTKPNAFFGYIPETTLRLPTPVPSSLPINSDDTEPIRLQPIYVNSQYEGKQVLPESNLQTNNGLSYIKPRPDQDIDLRTKSQYQVSNAELPPAFASRNENFALLLPQQPNIQNDEIQQANLKPQDDDERNQIKRSNTLNLQDGILPVKNKQQPQIEQPIIDPVKQEQQISKLATEIDELRSRIEELSSQNQMILNQQFNKSTSNDQTINSTTKPPNEILEEPRKP